MALKSRRIYKITEITESIKFRSSSSFPESVPICPYCGGGFGCGEGAIEESGEGGEVTRATFEDAAQPEDRDEADDRSDSRVRQAIAQEKGVLK